MALRIVTCMLLLGSITAASVTASMPVHAATNRCVGTSAPGCSAVYPSIGAAITAANASSGDTITVYGGTHNEYGLSITASMTIIGVGTVIISGTDRGGSILTIGTNATISATLQNLTFTNGYNEYGGAINVGGETLTVINCTFSANKARYRMANESGALEGGAIYGGTGSSIVVLGSAFVNNYANSIGGAIAANGSLTVTNSTFTSNQAGYFDQTQMVLGSYGGAISAGGQLTLTNSTFSANHSDSNPPYGYGDNIYYYPTTYPYGFTMNNTLVVNGPHNRDLDGTPPSGNNNLTGSFAFAGSIGDYGGPTQTLAIPTSGPAYGTGNTAICNAIPASGSAGIIDQRGAPRLTNGKCSIGAYEPGLVPTTIQLTASASSAPQGQNVSFYGNVAGSIGGYPANGETVAFKENGVTLGAAPMAYGLATYTISTLSPGSHMVTAVFGGDSLYAASPTSNSVTVTITQAPAITSADHTSFTEGTMGTFSITATGYPTPTLSVSGTLPQGLMFDTTHGTLGGIPQMGTAGTYPLTITATNGVSPPATQSFALTVAAAQAAPQITSADHTTYIAGMMGSFPITANGLPRPTLSLMGSLPAGVTFDSASGTLSGTPAAAGTFTVTITASNGIAPAATQSFTLTVQPTITAINPTVSPPAGNTLITVNGAGFVAGQTSVVLDMTTITNVQVISPTRLSFIAPAHTAAAVPLLVTVGGVSATHPINLVYGVLTAAPATHAPTSAVNGVRAAPTPHSTATPSGGVPGMQPMRH